jgi:hypothetical protein
MVSSGNIRRARLIRADLVAGAASVAALDALLVRLRGAFFLTGRLAEGLVALVALEDALARRATGLFRPLVLFFARLLTLRRARFAMIKIPFKFLTGLR